MTLSDVVAALINEALDLGYAAQDVSFAAILRNTHGIETGIPKILKNHRSQLRHDSFVRVRNNIVHRGRLMDDALERLDRSWSNRVFQKFKEVWLTRPANAQETSIDPQEAVHAANRDPETVEEIRAFTAAKATELREHLAATGQFLRALDECLAGIIRAGENRAT